MNTENIIEYIRRSPGLTYTKSVFWGLIFCNFMMLTIELCYGILLGGIFKVILIVSCVSFITYTVFVILFLRKKSPIKNKLLAEALAGCCMTCIVATMFGSLYLAFDMPYKWMGYYYLPLLFVPVFLFWFHSFRLNKSTPFYSKKNPVKITPLFHYRGRIALATLILAVLYNYFGHLISERMLEYIFLYSILLIMYFTPALFLDIQRYYYFTKLEKAGIVTEDILKPDEE